MEVTEQNTEDQNLKQVAYKARFEELFNVEQNFDSRTEAMATFSYAMGAATGNGHRVDSSRSGKTHVVIRCASTLTTGTTTDNNGDKKSAGKTIWTAETLPGFHCERAPGETPAVFKNRRYRELSEFSQGKICNMYGVLKTYGDGQWRLEKETLQVHSNSCTTVGKLTGGALKLAMKEQCHSSQMYVIFYYTAILTKVNGSQVALCSLYSSPQLT